MSGVKLQRTESGYAYPPLGIAEIRKVRVGGGSALTGTGQTVEWEVSTENATLIAASLGDVREFLAEIEAAREPSTGSGER